MNKLLVSSLATLSTIGLCFSSMLANAETLTVTPISASHGTIINTNSKTTTQQPIVYRQTTPIFYGTDGAYPFSSAVRVGNTLYMSGQMGFKDGELIEGGIKAQTRQTLDNINNTLLQYGYQKSDLVKCMVMLDDMDDFADFNEVYEAELTKPYPVRSAFEVSALAMGGLVEIECMAVK